MAGHKKQDTTWMAVLFTVCGGVLLAILLVMLMIRYRGVELELDRMLTESMTVHTIEAGDGAGYLIRYAETAMKNANLLIEGEERTPEKDWTETVMATFNLVDDRMELRYLDRNDLGGVAWGSQEPELLSRVLAGETTVSGLLTGSDGEDCYIVVLRPVNWEGRVAGVLEARIEAGTLLHQGQHSTFFHNVHSVIASEDGRIIYGSTPETRGLDLVELGIENQITEREKHEFATAYAENESGFYSYDLAGGRCYVAWGPISYNGWRVVQVSQSPTVHIKRSSMVQTGVMLASMAVCAVLAAMLWRQRGKLAEERLRYDALAQFKDTLLFEYDCASDSMEFTPNALDSLDLEDARLKRVMDEQKEFPIFHPDDIASVRRILKNAETMTQDQIEHDRIRLKKRDGKYSWYRSQFKAVYLPDGRVSRVIGTLTDISMQMDRERELREQAQRDPLTGLYNRAGVKVINARLEQISRGILFMLDLDDFKTINDTYGHAAGDKVLIAMGEILREIFRTDDIVARVGGDEFVAFLSGSDNELMAQQKAQELLDRIHSLKIEGIDRTASISIGICRAPSHGRTYESLSIVADEALYEVKKKGKGCFVLK